MAEQLLQVVPSVIRAVDQEFEVDVDFAEYLTICLENFDRVILACPVTTEIADSGLGRCRPLGGLPLQDRLTFVSLPRAYNWRAFLGHYAKVRRMLRQEIENADYLIFSPHAVIGDWAMVATYEAIKLQRSYGIEADVVYGEVAQVGWSRASLWKRAIKSQLLLPLFQHSYRHCLEHSKLALFQGSDVYNSYSKFCSNPFNLYHHIPVYRGDHITEVELQKKLEAVGRNRPLNICYTGRAVEMKGPLDWLRVIDQLIKHGVRISATWVGDGSLLSDMKDLAARLQITDSVKFLGFVSDRNAVMRVMKDSDIFLFCHKTRESARCLGEALACGCPLVGYGTAYPRDIVEPYGGGRFAPVGDWMEVAKIILLLDRNREELRQLIKAASLSGQLYDRPANLRVRVELVKKYLMPASDTVS